MRYLLMIYGDEKAYEKMSEADLKADMDRWFKYTNDLRAAKVSTIGEALKPTQTATSVTVRNGKTVSTDGPFAETKEQMGGFYLLEVKDLDEAIKWAGKCPGAAYGTIELRPVMEFPPQG